MLASCVNRSGIEMILDILTGLFLISGFFLVLRMFVERRRDVLHGPYVAKERDADSERRAKGKK